MTRSLYGASDASQGAAAVHEIREISGDDSPVPPPFASATHLGSSDGRREDVRLEEHQRQERERDRDDDAHPVSSHPFHVSPSSVASRRYTGTRHRCERITARRPPGPAGREHLGCVA